MKNLIIPLLVVTCLTAFSQTKLNDGERNQLVSNLAGSQADLLQTLQGLSQDQLNFKTDPDSWSIAEVVEHLALSEAFIFGLSQGSLKDNSDTLKGNLTDEKVLQIITSRENKVKTTPNLEPSKSFESYKQALNEFKTQRKKHIKYVKNTQEDLRNHFFNFPFGVADTYQVLLFMSGHTERHTKQVQEIMNNSDFPGA